MIRTRGIWMVFAAGVALAMLADPPSARASCGDYVKVGAHMPLTGPHGAMPAADPQRPNSPSPMNRPCSCPSCSENHKPLTPPAAPPVSVEQERWGQIA